MAVIETINTLPADIPYNIGRWLGRGGMSDVYEAESPDGRLVALKVFRNEKGSCFLEERFLSEARLLKTLYHPRVVRVRDFGSDVPSGRAWLVMDLVLDAEGIPVTLEDMRKRGGVPDEILRKWLGEMKAALAYLHDCGIVHRDVKLENILVDAEGHVRLADFGVSRIIDESLKSEIGVDSTFVTGETTGTRPVMGTYFYLPPDVRSGVPATPATDYYALGVAFFRLLTGMWYEPGTNAFDLLAPFPEYWRKELQELLEWERTAQSGRGTRPCVRNRRIGIIALVATVALIVICMVGSRVPRDRRKGGPQSSAAVTDAQARVPPIGGSNWALPPSFATPLVKSLAIGNNVKMDFCACPAGTFMMSNLDKTTCHRVTITRPFWITATPVTARQLRIEFPDSERDELAKTMEMLFTNMIVACKMQGGIVREYLQWLNMKYGQMLPSGYVFRLPTEAELEYAIREGGGRMPDDKDVYRDNKETKRLLESVGLPVHNNLRLLPMTDSPPRGPRLSRDSSLSSRVANAYGLATLWTDTEQAVLDTVIGKPGTKTAKDSISYDAEETDPLRTGALHLSRQFQFQRWLLMKDPSGFIRICIGPQLMTNHYPSAFAKASTSAKATVNETADKLTTSH